MAITLLHFVFITKYVAHFVAQSLLFPVVAITLFRKNYLSGPYSQVLSHICTKKIVIERTRDLNYLKFVATDFSPKTISPSAGENSGDLA